MQISNIIVLTNINLQQCILNSWLWRVVYFDPLSGGHILCISTSYWVPPIHEYLIMVLVQIYVTQSLHESKFSRVFFGGDRSQHHVSRPVFHRRKSLCCLKIYILHFKVQRFCFFVQSYSLLIIIMFVYQVINDQINNCFETKRINFKLQWNKKLNKN